MTSLLVICGLSLPQSKILGTPMNWRSPEKNFLRLFFSEYACACVLGPWPWPRAFLSLASRGSVLEKAVLGLGLGLGIFLCPWPWPRALCPRLHLWTIGLPVCLAGFNNCKFAILPTMTFGIAKLPKTFYKNTAKTLYAKKRLTSIEDRKVNTNLCYNGRKSF